MQLHRAQGPLQIILALLTLSTPCLAGDSLKGMRTLVSARLRANVGLASRPDDTGADATLWALRDAFVQRDADGYAALLAEDFTFRYRPEDVGPGECDTLDRAGEVSFARHLFLGGAASGAPPAEAIELDLQILAREGRGRWLSFLVMTHLRLHLPGGGEIRVDGPEQFLLRREDGEGGEWKIVE